LDLTSGRFELPYFASEAKTLSVELRGQVAVALLRRNTQGDLKARHKSAIIVNYLNFNLQELQEEV
jgi:hypothetical protein